MKQIFYPADILLPDKEVDMSRWSVIACDQFTSEPKYWEDVERIVGDAPSTLRLTLPEVYLESDEETVRLKDIRDSMEDYVARELLTVYPGAMIYIERTDSAGKVRAGIIGAIDLEMYDYHKDSASPVRATEGTIEERIPPRLRVRRNAPIELPHIMLLIDDIKKTVIEELGDKVSAMEPLYNFDLMKGGGHLKGWLLNPPMQKKVLHALDTLAQAQSTDSDISSAPDIRKVSEADSVTEGNPLLFAVGDGNHSLATAKEYYEQFKAAHPKEDLSSHPARFALAEIVNLHSPALEFEAIHRIVTNVNTDDLFTRMTKFLGLVRDNTKEAEYRQLLGRQREDSGATLVGGEDEAFSQQSMIIVLKGQEEKVIITKPTSRLTVGSLQNFLDMYIEEHSDKEDIKMDYIHGRDNLKALTWQPGSIGFILPDMAKEELFPSVKADGALPRKTFSMGHAEDKRYYTECRKIR